MENSIRNNKTAVFSFIAIMIALVVFTGILSKSYVEAAANQPAYFEDPVLEALIREELNKPEGDILIGELKDIEELSYQSLEIRSLKGIEALKNLTTLDVRSNPITDLEPLANLTNLTTLNIRETLVTDLLPLHNLVNLKYLNIHSTPATNLENLGNLEALETLIMRNIFIGENDSFLENLKNLTRLNIRNTNITSLKMIGKLMEEGALQDNLQLGIEATLDVRDNPIYVDDTADGYEPIRKYWENITDRQPDNLPVSTDLSAIANMEKDIKYEELFKKDSIIDIHIEIANEDWESILANPMEKEYKSINIAVNGIALENVGFRTKGNSTLRTTANSASERYSFKIKVDKYLEGQTLLGLDKFVLNGNVMDPSNIREYLTYELLREISTDAPLASFANIYINGELYGFYLMVEAIDDSFLQRNYNDNSGSLYKAGQGSSLRYVEGSNYDSLDLKLGYYESKTDLKNFIKLLNEMPQGEKSEIESVLDVDSALKYFAVNTVLGNYDSYHGNRSHNYYLHSQGNVFTILPWDFDLSFGGFARGEVTTISIDEPIAQGDNLEDYPLIQNLLAVEEYKERYYAYIKECLEYLEDFEEKVAKLAVIIRPYVEADPTKHYTMEQFEASISYSEDDNDGATINSMQNPMIPFENEMQRPEDFEGPMERQLPQNNPERFENPHNQDRMQAMPNMFPEFIPGIDGEPTERPEGFEGRQRNMGDNRADGPMGRMGGGSLINFIQDRVENIKQQLEIM